MERYNFGNLVIYRQKQAEIYQFEIMAIYRQARVREPCIDKRQEESNQFRNLAIYRQEADGVIILGIWPYTDKKQAESNELSVWESCHFHQEADSLKFMNRLEASGE